MSCSKCFILICLVLAGTACFVAYLYDAISVHYDEGSSVKNDSPFPNGNFDNVFWFVQISDIHISKFYGKDRTDQLKTFLSHDTKVIKPDLVLVTGDITDAKHADFQGSEQYIIEWETYRNAVDSSGILNRTTYFDIRGNHDSFNVPEVKGKMDFYVKYSHMGKKFPQSYYYIHEKSFGNYLFIGMDAAPVPGPKRPFNFFGVMPEEGIDILQSFKYAAGPTNHTVWFGHYPTSLIVSNGNSIQHLMKDSIAYLCGHLHTLGGLVNNMYTIQKTGTLELELGDWKDNRRYRIAAFDHDIMSFVDVDYGLWPVILITNPKDGQFITPSKEPLGRIKYSTHIRILVFSPTNIKRVIVAIDGEELGLAHHVNSSLYVLTWKPSKYSSGLHEINVTVEVEKLKQRSKIQYFTLDNSEVGFYVLPRIILMWDLSFVLKLLFWCTWFTLIIPLAVFRFWRMPISIPIQFSGWLIKLVQIITLRLTLLASIDFQFYALMIMNGYIIIGPWFIGELLDGHIGMCFIDGLYIDGKHLPMNLTYIYGFFHMLFFNIPLTWYLGTTAERQFFYPQSCQKMTFMKYIRHHGLFIVIFLTQAYFALSGFYRAYGAMAFILGPLRTWSLFIAVYLRWKVLSLQPEDCKLIELNPMPVQSS